MDFWWDDVAGKVEVLTGAEKGVMVVEIGGLDPWEGGLA